MALGAVVAGDALRRHRVDVPDGQEEGQGAGKLHLCLCEVLRCAMPGPDVVFGGASGQARSPRPASSRTS
eukprot:2905113-Rhodomonas_salina.1